MLRRAESDLVNFHCTCSNDLTAGYAASFVDVKEVCLERLDIASLDRELKRGSLATE